MKTSEVALSLSLSFIPLSLTCEGDDCDEEDNEDWIILIHDLCGREDPIRLY